MAAGLAVGAGTRFRGPRRQSAGKSDGKRDPGELLGDGPQLLLGGGVAGPGAGADADGRAAELAEPGRAVVVAAAGRGVGGGTHGGQGAAGGVLVGHEARAD